MLGFHTDIYYMLGHLGWVQFSNGVSVNNHKEFALEILMTMAHILNKEVPSLWFRLEGVEQVVPYEYIGELLGFPKGAPEQVDVHGGTLEGFWSMIEGGAHQQRNTIRNPINEMFHSWICQRILGRMRETKITDMEVNWLCYISMLAISSRPGITRNPKHILPGTSLGFDYMKKGKYI
jgi:hypothetical protein